MGVHAMDEKVRAIQERLRTKMARSLELSKRCKGLPLVSFEEVAGLPDGGDAIVYRVVAELRKRGFSVATIRCFNENTAPTPVAEFARPYVQAQSDVTVFSAPGRILVSRKSVDEPTLDDLIDAAGDGYDIYICESFGYLPLPKFLMTRKVQEGYNLGLPNVIGYISGKPDRGAIVDYFRPDDITGIADKIERAIIAPYRAKGGAKPSVGINPPTVERVPADAGRPA